MVYVLVLLGVLVAAALILGLLYWALARTEEQPRH